MNRKELLDTYYVPEIQLTNAVITNILNHIVNKNIKMLVFGLGYDSNLWFNATNKNTFFIENKKEYIVMNKNSIPSDNIIYYDYKNITVEKSFNLTDTDISTYKVPENIQKLAPFDVILVDGPEGWNKSKPGRLLSIIWSLKHLSKSGTIVYIDDCDRQLEKYCINKYLKDKLVKYFKERDGCSKFIL